MWWCCASAVSYTHLQAHDDEAGEDDAGQHRPAIEPVGDEQRRRQGIAEQALNVVRPDVEDLEPAPGTFLGSQGGEILVVQRSIDVLDAEIFGVGHGQLPVLFLRRGGV